MKPGLEDRQYWVATLTRIARPVLSALADGKLKKQMPVEARRDHLEQRRQATHLEALGRTIAGIAPWLELQGLTGDEETLRREFAELARRSTHSATNPSSPDCLSFSANAQALVDAAFLAHGLLRSPRELWGKLDAPTKARVIRAMKDSRAINPYWNNWLLFSAMVETFLCEAEGECDMLRIDCANRQHEQWYKGDGVYGDGPHFHWDYYNSFVIQPMLIDVMEIMSRHRGDWKQFVAPILERARRYAVIQERFISPEGAFPPIGRSLAYRFGAFQLLGQMALQKRLPESLRPAQVRCALTAVIRRTIEAEGTFDKHGWLRIGFCGHQPDIGERYISTGSLYLCLVGLLPLGLPPTDPFWSDPPEMWTSKRLWSGVDGQADLAL
jgi:hypothetical protein